ncbi:MAG: glucose-6-phosphate isomerase [Hyphomicrobiaceae bacterium]
MDQAERDVAASGPLDDLGHAIYRQDITLALETGVGASGASKTALAERLEALGPAIASLKAKVDAGQFEHVSILHRHDDIAAAETALAELSDGARTIIFLGTGGSSLGGQTLAQLSGWNIPGGADAAQKKRPRTRFYDNLDPRTLSGALSDLDLADARFVVTSKSGGTAETLTQMVAALEALREAGLGQPHEVARRFLAVSDPVPAGGKNALRALCGELGIPVLDHPPGIGGRFSGLSVVGLLPAIARGLDARRIRQGALQAAGPVAGGAFSGDAGRFAPAIGAALAVTLAETRGVRVNVMLPYADRLQKLGNWYVQLWAESLGKTGKGTTPIACLGPVDQHSQLQLFMDGPHEHYITIVKPPLAGFGPVMPPDLAQRAGIGFLAGRPVGDLVNAQADGVAEALAQAGRPVRMIHLGRVDEACIGAVMMHFMLETVLAASLMGIDAFDQPAVELAKRLARERLA